MGAALVGSGYAAWLLIPLVLSSELDGHVKGVIVTALGATPLATKFWQLRYWGDRHSTIYRHSTISRRSTAYLAVTLVTLSPASGFFVNIIVPPDFAPR
jgi:hypothetical protein